MNKRVVSIILVTILALIPCLPALAEGNSTVTITMATNKDIDITLQDKEGQPLTDWDIGDVEPNIGYLTNPTWCTITNEGNCVVEIRIKGEDATGAYTWKLSSTENNGKGVYALWYHIAYDDKDSYTLITKDEKLMVKSNGDAIQLIGNGAQKQFGLKLLTPLADTETGHFWGGREMKTTITISAVAA